jgi:hypothetical protein
MGMKDYTGDDVYAHTGVITNLSSGQSDWKYVVSGNLDTTVPPKSKADESVAQCLYTYHFAFNKGVLRCTGREKDSENGICVPKRQRNRVPAVMWAVLIYSTM